ncbi:ABC transporter permease [Devosia sp.]|uniref:ABC transporter permease n=1 Tax=Devosia sp. TaxID=1871048 RepID=UPI0032648162
MTIDIVQNSSAMAHTATYKSDQQIEAAAQIAIASRRRKVVVYRLALLVLLLGGWEVAGRTGAIDPFFFAMPSQIAIRLWTWIVNGTSQGPLWFEVWVTMEEAIIGFLTGAVAGVLAGIALGRNQFAADVFSIYIRIANAIPRIVLAPIFIMAFGLGLPSKVAVAFVMVFFVVFANAFQGVREADRAMIANAQILGASKWDVTRSVVVPSALSWIFASLHVSFGFAIVGAVVGELLGSQHGIGQIIAIARGSFDSPGVFGGMVVLIVVAMLADYIMTAIEHRIVKWRPAPLSEQS